MYCSRCGKEVATTSNFCGYCGWRVIKEEENSSVSKQPYTYGEVIDTQKQPYTYGEVIDIQEQPYTYGEVIDTQEQPYTYGEVIGTQEQPYTYGEVIDIQEQPYTYGEVIDTQNQSSSFDEVKEIQKQPSASDAVKDIQKKLREIDSRKKPPVKKNDAIKTAISVVRGKTSAWDLVLGDDFESKKIDDKKQLILDYPLPTSSKVLARFAKYINSEIKTKKKEPDPLMEVWKEKLKQVYLFAEAELSTTEEFAEIQKYYKDIKRRERRESIQVLVIMPSMLPFIALIESIILHLPLLMFGSIIASCGAVFLILYVFNLLDDMVDSIKQYSKKQKYVPKWLLTFAWCLVIPAFAAMITAIVYHLEVFIVVFAVLFGVDALFLLIFFGDEI